MIADDLLREALEYIRRTTPTPKSMELNEKITDYLREFEEPVLRGTATPQGKILEVLDEWVRRARTQHILKCRALASAHPRAAEAMWEVYCEVKDAVKDPRHIRRGFFDRVKAGALRVMIK